jgi:hypothetical protein
MLSLPLFGSPDYFSQDIPHVFESFTKKELMHIGCGTVECLHSLPLNRLMLSLMDAKSTLVTAGGDAIKNMPLQQYASTAYDGLTVPNMLDVARTFSLASANVPVVIGQAANEMDTLKFQYPLRKILTNLVQDRTKFAGTAEPEARCIQRTILNAQGLQETAEDFLFNIGSYIAASKPTRGTAGPRWHFLITAPSSITQRAWHTTAELLSWSPDENEDSAQYNHLTKGFVMGNAKGELRRYAHDNFLHFIRTGMPADLGWQQTERSANNKIAGLPSKLWDQAPLSSRMHYEHHHSNSSVHMLYDLMCDKPKVSELDMENCAKNSAKSASVVEELKQQLSVFKKSDLLFAIDIIRSVNPIQMLLEKQ